MVKLQYVETEDHITDILTKPLARVKFLYLGVIFGVIQIELPRNTEPCYLDIICPGGYLNEKYLGHRLFRCNSLRLTRRT